jgi:serine phosphatase RsbU (regulator of sigma subunit)
MEIAMCELDPDTLTMSFAGANSNIYLVRKGTIRIYKGDKQPIGESLSGEIRRYTNHHIDLQKGDCIYMITDGFADQFGGEKGKKFKYKPLEDLFCAVSGKNPREQKDIISDTFNNWKLNHEQVDDVLVIGIKV